MLNPLRLVHMFTPLDFESPYWKSWLRHCMYQSYFHFRDQNTQLYSFVLIWSFFLYIIWVICSAMTMIRNYLIIFLWEKIEIESQLANKKFLNILISYINSLERSQLPQVKILITRTTFSITIYTYSTIYNNSSNRTQKNGISLLVDCQPFRFDSLFPKKKFQLSLPFHYSYSFRPLLIVMISFYRVKW